MTTLEGPGERYRRRRRWPILALVTVLLVGAGVVWFQILRPTPALATGCNEPGVPTTSASSTSRSRTSSSDATDPAQDTAGSVADPAAAAPTPTAPSPVVTTALGQYVDASILATIRPANPQTIALQVFNGSQIRGQASTVTGELQGNGFQSIKEAKDDLLYPARDLNCYGQIRFGAAGYAQARTVLMVAPCAQLVMDNRIDATVDLSIGALYRFDPVSPDIKAQLDQIIADSAPPPVVEGQTAAARPLAPIPPLPQVDCSAGAPPKSTPSSSPSSSPSSVPSSEPTSSAPDVPSSSSEPSAPAETEQFPADTEQGEAPEVAPNDGGGDIFGG